MITVGFDLGSAAVKVVFTDGQNVLWKKAVPTTPSHNEIAEKLLQEGLNELSIKKDELKGIATTGYGRRLIAFADEVVDEISANATGAFLLSHKKARTVINVGGQDVKLIKISPEGKISDFKMNDKCAAGTGRFFELAEKILDIPVGKFGELSEQSENPACINNICAVFAESEIVSLLAAGTNRNDIIAGLHNSVARRIALLMTCLNPEDDIYLDGGPAQNAGLLQALEDELMREIKVLPNAQFTVAFGASVRLFKN